MAVDYRRPGFRAVMPGISVNGSGKFFEFLQRTFGATLRDGQRDVNGNFGHAELLIGDSVFELSEAKPQWPAQPCAHHVYVPDADACYARAIAAGASSMTEPNDTDYGDRAGNVKDAAGNHWYIATRLKGGPVPEGFSTVNLYVVTAGADKIMAFMKEAFGAKERLRVPCDDGSVMHAEMQLDDSIVELADGGGPWPPMPRGLHVYVPDVDATYQRALRAGATSVYAPMDQPYGDRECGVLDSAGNHWFIATFRHVG